METNGSSSNICQKYSEATALSRRRRLGLVKFGQPLFYIAFACCVNVHMVMRRFVKRVLNSPQRVITYGECAH